MTNLTQFVMAQRRNPVQPKENTVEKYKLNLIIEAKIEKSNERYKTVVLRLQFSLPKI